MHGERAIKKSPSGILGAHQAALEELILGNEPLLQLLPARATQAISFRKSGLHEMRPGHTSLDLT